MKLQQEKSRYFFIFPGFELLLQAPFWLTATEMRCLWQGGRSETLTAIKKPHTQQADVIKLWFENKCENTDRLFWCITEQVLVRRRAGLLHRARRAESRVRCGAVPAARARAASRSTRALHQTLLPRRYVSINY